MKFVRVSLLFLSAAMVTAHVNAQDFNDADLSFLSGQTKFNIEYNYDKMMVADVTEETYKQEKIAHPINSPLPPTSYLLFGEEQVFLCSSYLIRLHCPISRGIR